MLVLSQYVDPGITLVNVPKNGGGRPAFAVDTTTKRTTLIGIPGIPLCE